MEGIYRRNDERVVPGSVVLAATLFFCANLAFVAAGDAMFYLRDLALTGQETARWVMRLAIVAAVFGFLARRTRLGNRWARWLVVLLAGVLIMLGVTTGMGSIYDFGDGERALWSLTFAVLIAIGMVGVNGYVIYSMLTREARAFFERSAC